MEMCIFTLFGEKRIFVVLAKSVFQFWRENAFFGFDGKMYKGKYRIFGSKIIF